MVFRTVAADKQKVTKDAGVSATFGAVRNGRRHDDTWYGNIHKILSLDLCHDTCKIIFFHVKWFDRPLVCKDPVSQQLRIIKCTGEASDFTSNDPFISADKIDEKVFYGRIPSRLTGTHLPPLWVFSDLSSSHIIADHLLQEPQQEMDTDTDL